MTGSIQHSNQRHLLVSTVHCLISTRLPAVCSFSSIACAKTTWQGLNTRRCVSIPLFFIQSYPTLSSINIANITTTHWYRKANRISQITTRDQNASTIQYFVQILNNKIAASIHPLLWRQKQIHQTSNSGIQLKTISAGLLINQSESVMEAMQKKGFVPLFFALRMQQTNQLSDDLTSSLTHNVPPQSKRPGLWAQWHQTARSHQTWQQSIALHMPLSRSSICSHKS